MAYDTLRAFLNAKSTDEQFHFSRRCGTTIGYLRRRISDQRNISLELASAIERESRGAVCVEDLRPDLDVSHLRSRSRRRAA